MGKKILICFNDDKFALVSRLQVSRKNYLHTTINTFFMHLMVLRLRVCANLPTAA